MDFAFLVAYLALLGLALWRMKSTAWLVIVLAGSAGVVGALINFAIDRGHMFTRVELQVLLLVVLLLVVGATFMPSFGAKASNPQG
ncbi:MAG TPA: hypothetical protein DDY88_06195, partial [Actinobacteria bacterium]|nr:hypothetical protein [Actinomycetota bacterium]